MEFYLPWPAKFVLNCYLSFLFSFEAKEKNFERERNEKMTEDMSERMCAYTYQHRHGRSSLPSILYTLNFQYMTLQTTSTKVVPYQCSQRNNS